MPASLVFDLDGTLIDSAPDIAAAVNRMLAEQGHAPLDLKTVTAFVGNGLPKLVERVIRHCNMDMAHHAALSQCTLDHYTAAASALSALYPGVHTALETLHAQGHAMGICTNKPEAPARHILKVLNLAPFFDTVIGGDTLRTRKPDPEMLHACFAALPARPRLFVGDSEVDAETAQRAGTPFILFTKGYRKSPISALPHDACYDNGTELPDIVGRVLALANG